MVKSCVAPDGNFIASGSEDGALRVWDLPIDEVRSKEFGEFMDSVADVDWNSRYNMLAYSGFGHRYPILVFVHEKTQEEIDMLMHLMHERAFREHQAEEVFEQKKKGGRKGSRAGDLTTDRGAPSYESRQRAGDDYYGRQEESSRYGYYGNTGRNDDPYMHNNNSAYDRDANSFRQ